MKVLRVEKALDAVTATTTSNNIFVGDAERVAILITRANHSAGSSAFTFAGGISSGAVGEAPTTVALNTLIDNVTNTNAQTLTRVAGKTLSSNTSALLWLDLETTPVQYLNATVTETTDGTHSCWFLIIG